MFSNKMLYIPDYVVYEDIPTIIKYFEDFSIAKVKQVQVFQHPETEYYEDNYGYALIEIDYYYYNKGSCNFYKSIENNKGIMVYDDPLYWELQFSPFTETNNYNSDEEYCYTSDPEYDTKDIDYVYEACSSSEDEYKDECNNEYKDEYNYESYKNNYNSFKSKQKAKRQKLDEDLTKLKKTLKVIKNNQEKMLALLISNKKIKNKDNVNYKSNRFCIKY